MTSKRHYPNNGKKLLNNELKEVYVLITEQGYSIKSVALAYGRTPAAVVAKLNKTDDFYIGLTDPEFWTYGKKYMP
jgi:hypothetical protein